MAYVFVDLFCVVVRLLAIIVSKALPKAMQISLRAFGCALIWLHLTPLSRLINK